jgi:hypothetical protein
MNDTNAMGQPAELGDLHVLRVGTRKKSTAGHPYVECETKAGIAAF